MVNDTLRIDCIVDISTFQVQFPPDTLNQHNLMYTILQAKNILFNK